VADFDSQRLLADLIRDEGLKLMPYTDTKGKTTIGVGRNLSDNGISREEAMTMALNDIAEAVLELDRAIPWWRTLSPMRQFALANMQFNLGWPRLAGFRKMLAALKAGDFTKAASECLDSDAARDAPNRYHRIAKMLLEG
jgi:lysozyme